eukprot:CAMPEP_0181330184 /NCGR_PEP_ID=MMETSP1101-20121128/23753_1 /TAXON_ID=46948 /ORGANISM="Rhodomonas abbreviata, Strain Caron Lab Isolate" /LENGTH=49 /DNA_ID=CAMNT_0023439401 /DNA_START=144 /DNA_END=294 /DNA_ORIENTATION=+
MADEVRGPQKYVRPDGQAFGQGDTQRDDSVPADGIDHLADLSVDGLFAH